MMNIRVAPANFYNVAPAFRVTARPDTWSTTAIVPAIELDY
jgi:hypothetical protein